MTSLPDYRSIYSRDWQQYLSQEIHPAESVLLEDLRELWPRTRLLDLGVGTGRTTWAFAPLVDRYVGVDVVPEMVEHCKQTFDPSPRREFQVGDAQDLSRFEAGSFDVVVFSYNGIDHLSPQARERALEEIYRVLVPGGVYFFSSHSLTVFPHLPNTQVNWGMNPLRWLDKWKTAHENKKRYAQLNTQVASPEAKARGWAVLRDGSHSGDMEIYYCTPKSQVDTLEKLGFIVDKALTNRGKLITDLDNPTPSWWNYYLCRKPL